MYGISRANCSDERFGEIRRGTLDWTPSLLCERLIANTNPLTRVGIILAKITHWKVLIVK